jgi:hypothetical protein
MAPKFSATCKEAGVDGLILFPVAGPRAVVAFAGSAYRNRLLPIVGGDLPFPDYNASGGGYVIDDALDRIFRKAIEVGVDHFVIPGNTPDKVRHHAGWLVEKVERPCLLFPVLARLAAPSPMRSPRARLQRSMRWSVARSTTRAIRARQRGALPGGAALLLSVQQCAARV